MGNGIVYKKGINDMEYGWIKADEWNYRVYHVWAKIIQRCYDEKFHEKHQTYIECSVCERWLYLSNFVEDIVKIDGYEYWLNNPNKRVALDKDIKSNGENKEYNLENCMFVSVSENVRQAMLTRIYGDMKGKNNPMFGRTGEKSPRARKVVLIDPLTMQPVFTFLYVKQATDFYSISKNTLDCYLKGKRKTGHMYKGFLWYYLDDWQQLTK